MKGDKTIQGESGKTSKSDTNKKFSWGWWILSGLILLWFLNTNYLHINHCGDAFPTCKAGLKNLASAIDMYAVDHNGKFPAALSQLVPEYLAKQPHCSFHEVPYGYLFDQKAKNYTLYCLEGHRMLKKNFGYPQYCGLRGLIDNNRKGYRNW